MKKYYILFFCTIFCCSFSMGQLTVDLADKNKISESIPIDTEPVLIIENMIPGADKKGMEYTIDIDLKEIPIPALPLDAAFEIAKKEKKENRCDSDDGFKKKFEALAATTDEADVKKAVKDLKDYISQENIDVECVKRARTLMDRTRFFKKLNFSLTFNQVITITVTRKFKVGEEDTSSIIWVHTFKTETKSPWKIFYGFAGVSNMMTPVSNYFTKQDANGDYVITKMQYDNSKYFLTNISPTLMFSYMITQANFGLKFALTGGLSLNFASDVSNVNILAAPSLIIGENVSLSVGLALTQKYVLRGNYRQGDVIKESLNFDQLHEKKYFIPEYFISLAFRFDQNPFKKEEKSKDSDD